MQPYAERSAFLTLIEEQAIIPEALLPAPTATTETRPPEPCDLAALDELLERLRDVQSYI